MTTDWNKLKVLELKAELKRRGLPQSGLKQGLVNRLAASDAEAEAEAEATATAADAETGHSPSAEREVEPKAHHEAAAEEEDDRQAMEVGGAPQPSSNGAPQPPPAQPRDSEHLEEYATEPVAPPPREARLAPPDSEPSSELSRVNIVAQQELGTGQRTPSQLSAVAPAEIEKDARSRKRRSRSPPPPSEDSRKRARRGSEEATALEGPSGSSAFSTSNDVSLRDMAASEQPEDTAPTALSTNTEVSEAENTTKAAQSDRGSRGHGRSRTSDDHEPAAENRSPEDGPVSEHSPQRRDLSDRAAPLRGEGLDPYAAEERDIAPSIHPATSGLYIKNFMRPLRPAAVREYLVQLATPVDRSPDEGVILDFYLDQIRTHAFVVFTSVSAASRVRLALHDKVWPDESNRKALWVDFIPPDKVKEWVEMEQSEGGVRTALHRWEVVYGQDVDGNTTANLEEGGADTGRAARPPITTTTSVPSSVPSGPTGSSRPFAGVEGAPLGPRADRDGGSRASAGGTPTGEGWSRTRALPSLSYKPVSGVLARRRIDGIHSYKSKDPNRDVTGQLNRYTFESGDSFVDRGKEVFIGIRPPHRERERQRGLGGPAPRGPPPPYHYPRGDRYRGNRGDFQPRPRADGNPPLTFDGNRSDRWRRDSYRDRRY